ncbi:efflux RND transporter periplasmic adaptor subunit [Parvularcula sp. LCG005]|uniref:efflux RND transporter periplasmic adaptor subunit n=1 Tax=Parvularcula sp. LCG005 TaxID=3078805 RepID=UPI0029431CAD|nr:efflux RND transporter periplasmic adaptor subunit [Parvularcula sp. LCG005]WOI52387.1 efflux RND transporter periplasmic adaptor subunit [Parvularcula sp. LCG005]
MIRKLLVVLGNIGVIMAVIAVIVALGMLKPPAEQGKPQSFDPVVFVEGVEYAPVTLRVFAQGEVRPRQEIALTTQVGGKITMVSDSFAGGGVIRKGEVLVAVEDADYRLSLTRARAQVATAQQALAIERAESELAKRDYEELSSGDDLSGQPSDLTLRGPQLARAEAEYQAALANLQDAELALERTRIRAPFDGRVRSISANIGQFVSPGTRIGEIFSTDMAEIRLPLTDADLAKLGLPLAFSGDDGPLVKLSTNVAGKDRTWTGRIARVDAAIDPSTRQIAAIVQVDDPYGKGADDGFPLAIGLYVDALIEGPSLDSATTVPRIALLRDGAVYTIDGQNRIKLTPVTVAAYSGDGVVITDGLVKGDKVVVSRISVPVGTKVRALTAGEDLTDVSAPQADDTETDEANDAEATETSASGSAGAQSAGNAGAQ